MPSPGLVGSMEHARATTLYEGIAPIAPAQALREQPPAIAACRAAEQNRSCIGDMSLRLGLSRDVHE